MQNLSRFLVAFVALSHFGFMALQIFFWDHPVGEKVFDLPRDVLASSAALAANQGVYNGILGTGLIWAMRADKRDVKLFFLCAVVVAGVFGGLTAKFSILFSQALPGLLALVAVLVTPKVSHTS
jgi:putative membrane protein